jgi:hypothetical protein
LEASGPCPGVPVPVTLRQIRRKEAARWLAGGTIPAWPGSWPPGVSSCPGATRATRRAAVVEDALAGVEAGRRGRFAVVVGLDRGGQAAALAECGADVVVTDLGDLVLEGAVAGRGGR